MHVSGRAPGSWKTRTSRSASESTSRRSTAPLPDRVPPDARRLPAPLRQRHHAAAHRARGVDQLGQRQAAPAVADAGVCSRPWTWATDRSTKPSARKSANSWSRSGDAAAPRPSPNGERRESEFRRKATWRGYPEPRRAAPIRRFRADPRRASAPQIIREEFGRGARAPLEVPGAGHDDGRPPRLLEWGAEWQKEHFIPPTVAGEYRWGAGLQRAGRGQRSGVPEDPRRAGRRRVGDPRPENLDQLPPARPTTFSCSSGPSRTRPSTRRDFLPARPRRPAGHRNPAPEADHRRVAVQPGLLRRRAHARGLDRRRARSGLAGLADGRSGTSAATSAAPTVRSSSGTA